MTGPGPVGPGPPSQSARTGPAGCARRACGTARIGGVALAPLAPSHARCGAPLAQEQGRPCARPPFPLEEEFVGSRGWGGARRERQPGEGIRSAPGVAPGGQSTTSDAAQRPVRRPARWSGRTAGAGTARTRSETAGREPPPRTVGEVCGQAGSRPSTVGRLEAMSKFLAEICQDTAVAVDSRTSGPQSAHKGPQQRCEY